MTDGEVKDFERFFSEYSKSLKEELYSKLNEEQNLRKAAKSFYVFPATPDKVEKHAKMMQSNHSDNCVHRYNIMILNLFDQDLQLINIKPMIKNKLKELLSELKKFKVQIILVLEYKKRNDRKTIYLSAKLIASNSDIDEAFKSMHQSIMTKIKNFLVKTGFSWM